MIEFRAIIKLKVCLQVLGCDCDSHRLEATPPIACSTPPRARGALPSRSHAGVLPSFLSTMIVNIELLASPTLRPSASCAAAAAELRAWTVASPQSCYPHLNHPSPHRQPSLISGSHFCICSRIGRSSASAIHVPPPFLSTLCPMLFVSEASSG